MCKGLIGKKIGMTSVFTSEGRCVPVTVIQAGPCVVTQIKSEATDGYNALQLGFGNKKASRTNRPSRGHFKNSGDQCFSVIREVPVENPADFDLGQTILADLFTVGERVDVTGTSKGRGFAGVIKRHGFHGGKKTHGSHSHRIPGSVGCSATPSKVVRGKKLPGQYGNARSTTQNLEVVDIRQEDNLLLIKGAVPGSRSGLVIIQKLKVPR